MAIDIKKHHHGFVIIIKGFGGIHNSFILAFGDRKNSTRAFVEGLFANCRVLQLFTMQYHNLSPTLAMQASIRAMLVKTTQEPHPLWCLVKKWP